MATLTLLILLQILATTVAQNTLYSGTSLNEDLLTELSRHCPKYTGCYGDHSTSAGVLGTQNTQSCCLPCSCDRDICFLSGNCCPNVPQSIVTGRNATDKNATQPEASSLQCVTVFDPSGRVAKTSGIYHMATGVYMVTTCLEIYSNATAEGRCMNPQKNNLADNLPYTSSETGRTYRNKYCAQCNNDSMDARPWKMFIACTATSIRKADDFLFPNSLPKLFTHLQNLEPHSRQIEFLPPDDVDVTSQLCTNNEKMITNCSNTAVDDSIVSACANLNMPYIHVLKNNESEITTKQYANVFCYLCSGGNQSNPPLCPADLKVDTGLHVTAHVIGEMNTERLNATSIMSDWVQTDFTNPALVPSHVTCNETFVYDPYTKSCRQWYCPGWREYGGNTCIPVFKQFHNVSFTVHLKLHPSNDSNENFKQHNASDTVRQALESMYGTSDFLKTEVIVIAAKKDHSFVYVFARLSILGESEHASRVFDESTYSSDMVIESSKASFNVVASFSFGIKLELNSYSLMDIVVIDLIEFNLLDVVFMLSVEVIEGSFGLPVINKLTFCTQVLLTRQEVMDYNDNLLVLVSDMRLLNGEFMRVPANYREMRVCLSDYLRLAMEQLSPKPPEVISPQALLSVICNMMSIVGLIGTILTYIIFDELRSIPGKNNMMLAVHLLVAQLLYQFGMDKTEMPQACVVFGMLIHLFWLTAIFWMNACTLHMFRTFVTGKSYRSVRALDPQVCCYALYCYTVSVVMVSINVAVAVVKTEGKSIGYGGHICYISDPVMVGWVFALPVGVIILLNMGFFFAVVYQISASTMRRRGKSTDRANTIIYMKLSSLTGATWIFGYLYLWTDFVPFEYIFIVLNAGQGVLIFISFICTQRTTKLYRAFFRKHSTWLRACACFCLRKRLDSSDGQTAEPNTVKATLTAGSSTDSSYPNFNKISQRARGFATSLGLKLTKSKSSSKIESGSVSHNDSHCHSQGNSDIFQESVCGGKDVVTDAGKRIEVSVVSGSVNKQKSSSGVNGVYIPDKINGGVMSSTAVAAVSVHDLNVHVSRDPM